MQLSCQSLKKDYLVFAFDRHAPLFLLFILCPLVLFFQRYAVIILALAAIWSIFYLKKILTPRDIQDMLKRQITPPILFERYLNYGFIIVTLFDLLRPYNKNFSIELHICGLLTGGFLWWHAIKHSDEDMIPKLRSFLFYGIIACTIIIIIDYFYGSLLVASAEKIGKNRALIFAKVSMTLSLAMWPVLYNQSFLKTCVLSIMLLCLMPILDCDTASAGIIVGLVAYVLASINAKLFWRAIQVKTVILCISLPFIFNKILTDNNIYEINKIIPNYSYIHRLYIFQYTSKKIMERPFIGFGLNASTQDNVGGKMMSKPFLSKNLDGYMTDTIHGKQIPIHPHNMILQWWLEYGLIGVLWLSALLVFLVEKIRKLPLPARKITFAFFSTNMMILLVSIGTWQSWWWATWLFLLPLLTISKK